MSAHHKSSTSSTETASSRGVNRRSHSRLRFLAIGGLVAGTAVVSGATHTPAVWAVPSAILIGGIWIVRRPGGRRTRAILSAAILASGAGAALISPAVLLAWPAARLARLVQRRGLRVARVPLAAAAGVTALASGAAELGLPAGIAFLAIVPLFLIGSRRRRAGCNVIA
jgi:hypothetical protein